MDKRTNKQTSGRMDTDAQVSIMSEETRMCTDVQTHTHTFDTFIYRTGGKVKETEKLVIFILMTRELASCEEEVNIFSWICPNKNAFYTLAPSVPHRKPDKSGMLSVQSYL